MEGMLNALNPRKNAKKLADASASPWKLNMVGQSKFRVPHYYTDFRWIGAGARGFARAAGGGERAEPRRGARVALPQGRSAS